MPSNKLSFVASMTLCPSDIRKIIAHVDMAKSTLQPLANVLITPLFVSPRSLELVKEMALNGDTRVYFDSGGYYVQTGRMKYTELYMPLLEAYREHPWASVYTLPDHVPTSQDTPEEVERKVYETIDYSRLFFDEMPDQLKPKAMPVVQGHTLKQVDRCLAAYIDMGVNQVGFGSFGTGGKNGEINIATHSAVDLARYVVEVAHSHEMKVHMFGLGTPALVAMLKGIGADSFDSSSWLKSAGFGQVFLPFMRAYNISYNSTVSELQRGITFDQFSEWRNLTTHDCRLCDSLTDLQEHKMHRAVHNLIALVESVEMANQTRHEKIQEIYHNGSVRYRQEFEKWLQPG